VDRIEGAEERSLERSGGEQDRTVDGEERHRVEQLAGSNDERYEELLVVLREASDRPGISVRTNPHDRRSAPATNARSVLLSGSSRTSFTSADEST
jgi:hypothetical protein